MQRYELHHRDTEGTERDERQRALPVEYKGTKLDCGYRLDLLVERAVVVEIKAGETIQPIHQAQLLTCEVGLLLSFGPKPEIKRKAFGNSRKGSLRWLEEQPA